MLIRKPKTNSVTDRIQEDSREDKIEEKAILDQPLDEEPVEPNEPLDAPTELLIKSIEENDYKSAFQAIQNKAKVNILVEMPLRDFNNGREKPTFLTPLQMAVSTLNYKITKLLLKNGADPNILSPNGESTLELFLISLGQVITRESLGEQERYVPKFFELLHIQKEFYFLSHLF